MPREALQVAEQGGSTGTQLTEGGDYRSSIAPLSAGRNATVLTFEVGGRLLAIPVSAVQEIIAATALSCEPCGPSVLAGFLDLGGRAVPVLSLGRILGVEALPLGLDTPLIIVRHHNGLLGLLVEHVRDTVNTAQADRVALTHDAIAHEAVNLAGRLVPILDPSQLLFEQERRRIAESLEQRRKRMGDAAEQEK